MNLDDAQKKKVAGWIDEGMKLSDIQKRIASELGLTLTYMDVRLLVDDLKLVPKDPPPAPTEIIGAGPGAKPAPPSPGTADPRGGKPGPSPGPGPGLVPGPAPAPDRGGLIGGKVSVGVDAVARPGTMISGSVTFSDGQKAVWYLDQYGQLGVAPEQKGYKPSPADVQSFQAELERELAKFGY
jgi:hypothetical protein